jgi:HAMP domain-containing protein
MRWKILAGNLVTVILISLVAWFLVKGQASEKLLAGVAPAVQRSVGTLEAVRALDGDQLTGAVEDAAQSAEVATVYAGETESAQREAAFTVSQSVSRQLSTLQRRGRPAELVVLLNAEGRVLARNVDRNLDVGRDLRTEFPAVRQAFEGATGHSVRDFIHYGDQGWMEIAVVPVLANGRIRGGVLAGFAVADSAARMDAERMDVGVGYLFREGNRYTVQSLSVGSQREKEELVAWANSPAAGGDQLLRRSAEVRLTLGGEDYLARMVAMPGVFSPQSGAIVLKSLTAAQSPAGDVAFPVLAMMLLGLALSFGYNLFIAQYFEKPIEQIEEGLLTIVNGNTQHRINVEHAELGGIVYRINQLVASLTGEGDEGGDAG